MGRVPKSALHKDQSPERQIQGQLQFPIFLLTFRAMGSTRRSVCSGASVCEWGVYLTQFPRSRFDTIKKQQKRLLKKHSKFQAPATYFENAILPLMQVTGVLNILIYWNDAVRGFNFS